MTAFNHTVGRLADMFRTRANQLSNDDCGLLEWAHKYLGPYFTKNECALHYTLNVELERIRHQRAQKINIVAPRGYAKSTWKFAKVLKAICERSERYIMMISDTGDQAKADLTSIRTEFESNTKLREDYPAACAPGAIWNSTTLVTSSGCCIEALGTGMKVRGRKYRNFRPSLVLVDDPDNDEDILSATERTKHWEWVNKALLQVGETNDTSYIFIGTMLHRECIVGQLEHDPRFRTIKFAAVQKWPKNMHLWDKWERMYLSGARSQDDKGVVKFHSQPATDYRRENIDALTEGAQILWAAKEDLFTLMEMRAVDHKSFASEKQNDPRDPSKCEFPEDWFGEDVKYDHADLLHKLATEQHATILCTDPAKGGDTKKHDYSPILLLHYFGKNEFYVEIDMRKLQVTQLCEEIVNLYRAMKLDLIGFESIGFQELIGDQMGFTAREMFLATCSPEQRENVDLFVGNFMSIVEPVENGNINKNTRISRLGIWLKRKCLRFNRACPYTMLLLQQLMDHPHAAHDDGPDVLEQGVRLLSHHYALGSVDGNTT